MTEQLNSVHQRITALFETRLKASRSIRSDSMRRMQEALNRADGAVFSEAFSSVEDETQKGRNLGLVNIALERLERSGVPAEQLADVAPQAFDLAGEFQEGQ